MKRFIFVILLIFTSMCVYGQSAQKVTNGKF